MISYILETVVVGPMNMNCYILGCARTLEAVIIDPGADHDRIKERLKNKKLSARFIVNTHGHADHIGANENLGLPIMIHRSDVPFLSDSTMNLSAILGTAISSPPPDRVLEDGDKIRVGDLILEVIHTPGHTPGSISVRCDDVVFTGDALFNEGIGRTDLPYSSEEDLMMSIREKLLLLPDSTKVYPGHGAATTIGHERERNPFF